MCKWLCCKSGVLNCFFPSWSSLVGVWMMFMWYGWQRCVEGSAICVVQSLLFLLAPLADEACHSLPRTGCARTRRCCEFPPPPVSQTPSSKGKNNNKHFSSICITTYTWKGAHELTPCWQLQTLLCLWEHNRDGELHFVFWRSNWRSPEGIILNDVCSLLSVRVFHSWSDG